MSIKKVSLTHFTVFEEFTLTFSKGINVLIGPNGVGKTHLLKVLYSACRAADPKVSFSHKLVRCFAPEDHRISRLVRRKHGNHDARVTVTSYGNEGRGKTLGAAFSRKTKKWDAAVSGEDSWEKQLDELNSVFIPAKEILSHSYNLNAAVEMNNVSFDDTYLDVINSAKIAVTPGKDPLVKKKLLDQIEKIIDGKVTFDGKRDEFYLKKGNTTLEFNLVAEGIRKIALLWQLVKNGILMHGSVLFWDEPEANINPAHVPVLVELLLELQRNGVQIFLSTHDYFLAKYLEIKREEGDQVLFHALFFQGDQVMAESGERFSQLENNAIMETFIRLYRDEVDQVMGP